MKRQPIEWKTIFASCTVIGDSKVLLTQNQTPRNPTYKCASEPDNSQRSTNGQKRQRRACLVIKEMQFTLWDTISPNLTAIIKTTNEKVVGLWGHVETHGCGVNYWGDERIDMKVPSMPHDPASLLLGIYPKESKYGYRRDNLYFHVYRSTIPRTQGESTEVSVNRWRNMIDTHSGVLLSRRKEQNYSICGKWAGLELLMWQCKLHSKRQSLHVFMCDIEVFLFCFVQCIWHKSRREDESTWKKGTNFPKGNKQGLCGENNKYSAFHQAWNLVYTHINTGGSPLRISTYAHVYTHMHIRVLGSQ